jgi:hypothetical protein
MKQHIFYLLRNKKHKKRRFEAISPKEEGGNPFVKNFKEKRFTKVKAHGEEVQRVIYIKNHKKKFLLFRKKNMTLCSTIGKHNSDITRPITGCDREAWMR